MLLARLFVCLFVCGCVCFLFCVRIAGAVVVHVAAAHLVENLTVIHVCIRTLSAAAQHTPVSAALRPPVGNKLWHMQHYNKQHDNKQHDNNAAYSNAPR
jgi:hypothetical protein